MITFGCINSNINPYSIALANLGFECLWLFEKNSKNREISMRNHSNILHLDNTSKMCSMILCEQIKIPDVIFGKNPSNQFNIEQSKKEFDSFIEIKNLIDAKCDADKRKKPIIIWEDVENVLQSNSNLFGYFLGKLAGKSNDIKPYDCNSNSLKWMKSGSVIGDQRKSAWRVLNSKMFGIPQQRKRLYVVATDTKDSASSILDTYENMKDGSGNLYDVYANRELSFVLDNKKFNIFREYVDALNGAYGTAWNSLSVLENGSLLLNEDDKLRRFTPLEFERLMGLPDDYTKTERMGDVARYKIIANSSVVNVLRWIGYRIIHSAFTRYLWNIDARLLCVGDKIEIKNILETKCDKKYFVSDVAKKGMIKRVRDQKLKIRTSLFSILES
jgi:DNA (cytosine-5)-methyltransferase 1